MEKNTVKKLGVVTVTAVIVALFLTIPVFYFVAKMPLAGVCIAAIIYVSLSVALVYYARERFGEIEEGLDDAVEHY